MASKPSTSCLDGASYKQHDERTQTSDPLLVNSRTAVGRSDPYSWANYSELKRGHPLILDTVGNIPTVGLNSGFNLP